MNNKEINKEISLLMGTRFKFYKELDAVREEYTHMLKDITRGSALYRAKEKQIESMVTKNIKHRYINYKIAEATMAIDKLEGMKC